MSGGCMHRSYKGDVHTADVYSLYKHGHIHAIIMLLLSLSTRNRFFISLDTWYVQSLNECMF